MHRDRLVPSFFHRKSLIHSHVVNRTLENITEHKKSTILSEVGLQVWRGAFLINDFILSNRELFSNKRIIELGSGVGLTSILASIYAKKVICTDLNIGGILDLIKRNVELNKSYQRTPGNVEVHELDFLAERFSVRLEDELNTVDIAVAADGEKK